MLSWKNSGLSTMMSCLLCKRKVATNLQLRQTVFNAYQVSVCKTIPFVKWNAFTWKKENSWNRWTGNWQSMQLYTTSLLSMSFICGREKLDSTLPRKTFLSASKIDSFLSFNYFSLYTPTIFIQNNSSSDRMWTENVEYVTCEILEISYHYCSLFEHYFRLSLIVCVSICFMHIMTEIVKYYQKIIKHIHSFPCRTFSLTSTTHRLL